VPKSCCAARKASRKAPGPAGTVSRCSLSANWCSAMYKSPCRSTWLTLHRSSASFATELTQKVERPIFPLINGSSQVRPALSLAPSKKRERIGCAFAAKPLCKKLSACPEQNGMVSALLSKISTCKKMHSWSLRGMRHTLMPIRGSLKEF
jgi:hypothetical protein